MDPNSIDMQFIKQQDKLFKEEQVKKGVPLVRAISVCFFLFQKSFSWLPKGSFDEAEEGFRSQIKILDEELARKDVGTPYSHK